MKSLKEMQLEGVSPHLAHLALRPSKEKCFKCDDRREQQADHSVESIAVYSKSTYLTDDGVEAHRVKDCYFPLSDARLAPRDLCSSCRWQAGKANREEATLKKHRIEAIKEKLSLPLPLSHFKTTFAKKEGSYYD